MDVTARGQEDQPAHGRRRVLGGPGLATSAWLWLFLLLPGLATADPDPAAVTRGEYLVSILGCGRCHTEGYLFGNRATGPALAGSRTGIAYTGTDGDETPGLVFAGNLTPDRETGLGDWSVQQILRVMSTGIGSDGHQRLPVMPWANYGSALTREDRLAIAHYLKSLPPVSREIPDRTRAGGAPEHAYVRFGLYRFEPFD